MSESNAAEAKPILNGEVHEISITPFSLTISAVNPLSTFLVSGPWKLLDSKGQVFDEGHGREAHTKASYKIQMLIGKKITAYQESNKGVFEIEMSFDNGFKLQIAADR